MLRRDVREKVSINQQNRKAAKHCNCPTNQFPKKQAELKQLNQEQANSSQSPILIMLGRFPKILAVSALGVFAISYVDIPTQYYPVGLLPLRHMYTIVNAGVSMTVIYKLSTKPQSQKHVQASHHLMVALRRNGGLYIKLGQLIASLDVIVPDEYRNTMLALTRDCEVNSFQDVKAVVEEQTHQPLSSTFSEFSQQPISSASIGQVHHGRLTTGEQVAVKVQHRGLSQNMQYDLRLMRIFVNIAKMLFTDFKYEWLLEEFTSNIQKELDFEQEAINMELVKQILIKEKFNDDVIVPKVLRSPTKRLLIMEYCHGFHVDEIQQMKRANIDMKHIGKTFSKVIIKMIHKYGFVHGDPHSGNLLVRKLSSGRDQLVLLDHGLCQRLDTATREQYNWFWLGLILNNQHMAAEAAEKLGTKKGVLLCSVLTSRTSDELRAPSRNIFDLNPNSDKTMIIKRARERRPEIVELLSEIHREILLLLKVNEFARAIENMLGGREKGVYEDIARCCLQNLPLSFWHRWSYLLKMWWLGSRH